VSMLTAAEVATQLGLSPRAVYELHASGRLPGYRFGRAVRFEPADVEAFKAACRTVLPSHVLVPRSAVALNTAPADLAAYFKAAGLKPKIRKT
jgi:excisionase family DNA binding protein